MSCMAFGRSCFVKLFGSVKIKLCHVSALSGNSLNTWNEGVLLHYAYASVKNLWLGLSLQSPKDPALFVTVWSPTSSHTKVQDLILLFMKNMKI